MPINNYNDLNDMHLDVLREIGNIGCGNAATSLSTMLDRPIDISVPTIKLINFQQVTQELGGPESMIVGMMLTLTGDVKGMMMFLLEKNFAHMALNGLLGTEFTDFSEIDELGMSALQEVSNIMAASYVNAISSLTGLTIDISVPSVCLDMAGSILSVPTIYFANISDTIIYIKDNFTSLTEGSKSSILLIPDVESLEKIMNILGIEI